MHLDAQQCMQHEWYYGINDAQQCMQREYDYTIDAIHNKLYLNDNWIHTS